MEHAQLQQKQYIVLVLISLGFAWLGWILHLAGRCSSVYALVVTTMVRTATTAVLNYAGCAHNHANFPCRKHAMRYFAYATSDMISLTVRSLLKRAFLVQVPPALNPSRRTM